MTDAKLTSSAQCPNPLRAATIGFITFTLLWGSTTALAWEPESDYADSTTYMGLSGLFALTNFNNESLGQRGSKPVQGINSVDDSGGLRFWIGHRPITYLSFEVAFQYVAPIKMKTDYGKAKMSLYSGSLDLKGYPFARLTDTVLEGRLQPYLVVSPMVTGAHVQASNRAPDAPTGALGFAIGVGLGGDYWLNDTFSLNVDARYYWGTADIQHIDYATFAFGARYHFE